MRLSKRCVNKRVWRLQGHKEAGAPCKDGKILRGSLEQFANVRAPQWVSAFATDERLVSGPVALADGDKVEEIAVAWPLIQDLGVKRWLFKLMRCIAKKSLQLAQESGNNMVLPLKANEPTLLDATI